MPNISYFINNLAYTNNKMFAVCKILRYQFIITILYKQQILGTITRQFINKAPLLMLVNPRHQRGYCYKKINCGAAV